MRTLIMILGISIGMVFPAQSQEEANPVNGSRFWYSLYLNKKITQRWSIGNFSPLATRSAKHEYAFFQNDLGVNYRLNRIWSLHARLGVTLYKYSSWWEDHYDREENALNAVAFGMLSLGIKRSDRIGEKLQLKQSLIVQHYLPRYEKYQNRFQYAVRLAYRKKDLFLKARPFLQAAIYYYHNGIPTDRFDEEGNWIGEASSNGFHRYRLKGGINFRPFKGKNSPSFTLYYAYNKEFNWDAFGGNDLNIEIPGEDGEGGETVYPFNNYRIVGVQLNYFFRNI